LHNVDSQGNFAVQGMRVFARTFVGAFLLAATFRPAGSGAERVNLFPKLGAGQVITYRIRFRVDTALASQSSVVMPLVPSPLQVDVLANVRVEFMEVQSAGSKALIHARMQFEALHPEAEGGEPGKQSSQENASPDVTQKKMVEFTIHSDGQLTDVKGDDALSPEEHQAWAEWVSLFAMAAVFPEKGIKRGEKWESEEAEKAAASIAGLTWLRRSTYVQDEPCERQHLESGEQASKAGQAPQTCAVIVTTATLRQKSSRKDATPEDFKLHQLRTTGTARGTNQVIAYISLKTGLVVRATEEASQSMDVTLEKVDGSNRVHYKMDAKSNAEVLLVADTPLSDH